MIDSTTEDLLPLSEVPHELPRRRRGHKLALSTVYRWTSSGCRGVVLESIQLGACRYTSREALQRFFEILTQKSVGSMSGELSPRSTAARRRAIERADKDLDKLGV